MRDDLAEMIGIAWQTMKVTHQQLVEQNQQLLAEAETLKGRIASLERLLDARDATNGAAPVAVRAD